MIKKVIGALAAVALIALVMSGGLREFSVGIDSPVVIDHEKDKTTVVAAGQLNDQWKQTFDKTGEYPARQNPKFHYFMYGQLVKVQQESQSYAAARLLIDDFAMRQIKIDAKERKAQALAIAEDSSGRASYADQMERNFLEEGKDVKIRSSGPKNTNLTVTYILINRPFVYHLQNKTSFLENAWKLGFKKVVLQDSEFGGSQWVFSPPKDNAVGIANK